MIRHIPLHYKIHRIPYSRIEILFNLQFGKFADAIRISSDLCK